MAVLKQIEKRKQLRRELYNSLYAEGVPIPLALKTLRKVLSWDQERLAKEAGVSLSALRRIEQGHSNVRLETIEKILARFDLSIVVKR